MAVTDPGPEPSSRCQRHVEEPSDHPCSGCGDARAFLAEWSILNRAWIAQEASTAARARAELRRAEISHCHLCDDDGYYGGLPCRHDPLIPSRARAGLQACREALR